MMLFIELCVDLRKGKAAKDGLYNYKNTSQNTNVATIEVGMRTVRDLPHDNISDQPHSSSSAALSNLPNKRSPKPRPRLMKSRRPRKAPVTSQTSAISKLPRLQSRFFYPLSRANSRATGPTGLLSHHGSSFSGRHTVPFSTFSRTTPDSKSCTRRRLTRPSSSA